MKFRLNQFESPNDDIKLFPNAIITNLHVEHNSNILTLTKKIYPKILHLRIIDKPYSYIGERIYKINMINYCPYLIRLELKNIISNKINFNPIKLTHLRHLKIALNVLQLLKLFIAPQLRTLQLSNSALSNYDLHIIHNFKKLISLTLSTIQFSDKINIIEHNTIKKIHIFIHNIQALDISKCKMLQNFKIDNIINVFGFPIIYGLNKCIRRISLTHFPQATYIISTFENMPHLKHINLSNSNIENVEVLNTCTNLRTITINKSDTTNTSILNKNITLKFE